MKRIEGLDKVFKGASQFYLPSAPDKPLIFEIGQSEELRPEDASDDWQPPTEMVKAAIAPINNPPIKNTWDGLAPTK